MNHLSLSLLSAALVCCVSPSTSSGETIWSTEFSNFFHDISGSVRSLDEDTLSIENFTYDGGGIVVKFYLGSELPNRGFDATLALGEDLFGTAFDGSQPPILLDLPEGDSLFNYSGISVWCVTAGVNFGSGTFDVIFVDPSPADINGDGNIDILDLDILSGNFGSTTATPSEGDINGDGNVDILDLDILAADFGTVSMAIPEPTGLVLAGLAVASSIRRSRA